MIRHFLRLADLTATEHQTLRTRAKLLKKERAAGLRHATLAGKTIALVFEKSSTRTRASFEAGIKQLGGDVLVLDAQGSQLGRGEPIEDTARVLSSYVDAIMLRTFGDERLEAFAKFSRVPVINGLSDGAHPVQLLADLQTVDENFGTIDVPMAFVGDGSSNMARSFVEAARLFGFLLTIACPEGYEPPADEIAAAGGRVRVVRDPREAVKGVSVVNTDVWTSMGQEAESKKRLAAFAGFTVDGAMMALAAPDAIVLHCLPAHRGEEISAEVLEGAQSRVWQQAENRMHAQKALLEILLPT
jgi:ornithine carbamoyltransferase